MMYEVEVVQQEGDKGRVVRKEFSDYAVARQYAHDMVVDDNRVVKCSIYKGEHRSLVMDVL